MEATLKIEAPASCTECKLASSSTGWWVCSVKHIHVGNYCDSRHPGCPLKIEGEERPLSAAFCPRCGKRLGLEPCEPLGLPGAEEKR